MKLLLLSFLLLFVWVSAEAQSDTVKSEWKIASIGAGLQFGETPPYSPSEFFSFSKDKTSFEANWLDYNAAGWEEMMRARSVFICINSAVSIEKKFKYFSVGFLPSLSYFRAHSACFFENKIDSIYLEIGFKRHFISTGNFVKLTFPCSKWGFYTGLGTNVGFSFAPKVYAYEGSKYGDRYVNDDHYIKTNAKPSFLFSARVPIGVELTVLKRIQFFSEREIAEITLEAIANTTKTTPIRPNRGITALGIRYRF